MALPDSDNFFPRRARPSFATTFLRLYHGDPLFRSSTDFAGIGLAVYMFVAPLPLPSIDWITSSASGNAGSPTAGKGAPAAASPAVPANIAQAATPPSAAPNRVEGKIRREWFKLSAAEIVPALHRASDELAKGSFVQSRQALEQIARPDDPNVLYLVAIAHVLSHEKDWKKHAFDAYMRAALAGHPEAMDEVAQYLRLGEAGPVNMQAAIEWYEKGVAAGSGSAATNLGRVYYNGWGRLVDYARAVEYYKIGAERGDAWGMHNFGGALVNGQGIDRDAARGREWIEKAAATGLPTAQHSLAKLTRKGLGGPVDLNDFLQWAQAAANQGFAPALYDLGMFYLQPDDGRPADPARAAGYLRQAALKKHAAAQFAFATLNERGVGVQQNPVQAFVYYSLALRGRLDAKDLETAQKLVAAAAS